MFLGATAILLHYENYIVLNNVLQRTYFLRERAFSNNLVPSTFIEFRPTFEYMEDHIKPKSENPNLYTLAGDMVSKRDRMPLINKVTISNADLVLYQLSDVFDFSYRKWFPILYVYWGEFNIQQLWSKLISRKYCQKLFPLFGVDNIDKLKAMIAKDKPVRDMRYEGCFYSALPIQYSIEIEKIGSMP